jgi:hypothetical protein
MGWAGGSYIARDIWKGIEPLLPEGSDVRSYAARVIVEALENEDWDTQDECPSLMLAAYGPDWRDM